MPDNIDSLLNSFGINPSADEQTTSNESDKNVPEAQDVTSTDTESGSTDTKETTTDTETETTETAEDTQAQLEQQRANQAFAAMRAENSKYKKFMQTLMKGSNFTGDEAAFIEALENEAYKKQAQLQGMAANPELLRKVDQQEEQIRELKRSQNDQTLMLGLKTLQQTNNLTGKEVEMFVQRAIENKIDLLAPGVNFDTLYKGMFFEDIVKKKIEAERQNWIKQSNKANDAANPDGKSGKRENSQTDVKTMAEFNSLLNNVSKEIN
jgi:hypothetical protein